ncbi:MAG: cupin domain-containing protein [Methylacidiphilales bacterium]|nr:cupin domain-containing protein [Candidatus Methylacidiphilales bacterium]
MTNANSEIIQLNAHATVQGERSTMTHDHEQQFAIHPESSNLKFQPGETTTSVIDIGLNNAQTGFWTCSNSLCLVNFKVWQYCHFLEGEAIISNQHGKTWHINNQHGFIIPYGFKGVWHTTKKILNHYTAITQDAEITKTISPDEIIMLNPQASHAPSPSPTPTPPEKLIHGTLTSQAWDFFNCNNNPAIDCGLWECDIGKRHSFFEGYTEVERIIKGQCVITNQMGKSFTFTAGDIYVIPKDFKGTWETVSPLVKEYVVIT